MDLNHIRKLYSEAANGIPQANELYDLLTQEDISGQALLLGYQAAAYALKARSVWNPIDKLMYIKKSQETFKEAIILEEDNIEIRFLRFSIQYNTPAVLGFSQDMVEDKNKIVQSVPSDRLPPRMQYNMIHYLINSNQCSEEEVTFLKTISE